MENGKRILIVEDEAISAMALEKLLQNLGCVVVGIVATGENAVAIAKAEKPDIIAMDIRLAGKMDGVDAATLITSELGIPIIFMTGYDDGAIKARAISLKPLGYVVKPLDLKKIKAALGMQ
jgi:two-component system, response regulator PdtaR